MTMVVVMCLMFVISSVLMVLRTITMSILVCGSVHEAIGMVEPSIMGIIQGIIHTIIVGGMVIVAVIIMVMDIIAEVTGDMADTDNIIFNDADGSDEDVKHYEWLGTTLYQSDCNAWDDPIFFVQSDEGGYGIIYDDQKEDVRYSIIIGLRMDASHKYEGSTLYVTYGKAWKGEVGQEYKPLKKIELPNKFEYQYFLDIDNHGMIQLSSINKVIRLANKFLTLRAFT